MDFLLPPVCFLINIFGTQKKASYVQTQLNQSISRWKCYFNFLTVRLILIKYKLLIMGIHRLCFNDQNWLRWNLFCTNFLLFKLSHYFILNPDKSVKYSQTLITHSNFGDVIVKIVHYCWAITRLSNSIYIEIQVVAQSSDLICMFCCSMVLKKYLPFSRCAILSIPLVVLMCQYLESTTFLHTNTLIPNYGIPCF